MSAKDMENARFVQPCEAISPKGGKLFSLVDDIKIQRGVSSSLGALLHKHGAYVLVEVSLVDYEGAVLVEGGER